MIRESYIIISSSWQNVPSNQWFLGSLVGHYPQCRVVMLCLFRLVFCAPLQVGPLGSPLFTGLRVACHRQVRASAATPGCTSPGGARGGRQAAQSPEREPGPSSGWGVGRKAVPVCSPMAVVTVGDPDTFLCDQ